MCTTVSTPGPHAPQPPANVWTVTAFGAPPVFVIAKTSSSPAGLSAAPIVIVAAYGPAAPAALKSLPSSGPAPPW